MNAGKRNSRLVRLFRNKAENFQSRLSAYVEEPTVDAIHDVRTSFRRLEACYSIVPLTARTADCDSYLALGKSFFQFNGVIRDGDVILEKLTSERVSNAPRLCAQLQKARIEQLTHAMQIGIILKSLPLPELADVTMYYRRTLRRTIQNRIEKIKGYLPLVLGKQADAEKLHAMRKHAKKLFYLLELEVEPSSREELITLKGIHGLAGDIHDCDITIDFLLSNSSTAKNTRRVIAAERNRRHMLADQLIGELEKVDWTGFERMF